MDAKQLRRLDRRAMEQLILNAQRLIENGPERNRAQARSLLALIAELPAEAWIEIQFRDEGLPARMRRLIEVVADHPGATSAELTQQLAGRAQNWQMHFGAMCRDRLGSHVKPSASQDELDDKKRGAALYAGVLCDFDSTTRGFTLKPEVHAALVAAGVLGRAPAAATAPAR